MTNPIFDFYRGKRVLVTGHTGFKGSWLCEILLLAGAQVTGYSLNPPSDPSLFELLGLSERMDSRIGDVRDLAHMKQVFEETQPEIVLHLAAQPIVRESYKKSCVYLRDKRDGNGSSSGVRKTLPLRPFLGQRDDRQGL